MRQNLGLREGDGLAGDDVAAGRGDDGLADPLLLIENAQNHHQSTLLDQQNRLVVVLRRVVDVEGVLPSRSSPRRAGEVGGVLQMAHRPLRDPPRALTRVLHLLRPPRRLLGA